MNNGNVLSTSDKQERGLKRAFEMNLETKGFYSWFRGGM